MHTHPRSVLVLPRGRLLAGLFRKVAHAERVHGRIDEVRIGGLGARRRRVAAREQRDARGRLGERERHERVHDVGEARVAEEESWAHLAVEGRELYVRDLEGLTAYEWK